MTKQNCEVHSGVPQRCASKQEYRWLGDRRPPALLLRAGRAESQLCHPSTPLLGASVQQGGRAGPVLAKRSHSLQKHQIFMLRKPWKASANASLGGNCARAWDQEKEPPPPLGKPCWRAGHSSLPGGRASPERSEKRLPLGG